MEIAGKVGVVTGAGGGIGTAIAMELVNKGIKTISLVDASLAVNDASAKIRDQHASTQVLAFQGDVTDGQFRRRVYDETERRAGAVVNICVPAAGITRDALAVKLDKVTGKAQVYDEKTFLEVLQVNLVAPVYWAVEMVARIAEDRARRGLKRWDHNEHMQGVAIFIGSVSSQGNKGQIAYAATKSGLEGAARTLMKEAIFYGVRCAVIHPGFTDTPMVRKLGAEFIEKNIVPYTQIGRLIRPEEIATAISFMISNSAISGELWADAGWHPPA